MARSTDHRGDDVSRTTSLRAATIAILTLLAATLAVTIAPAARASCIADPASSPYSFTGVVARTELGQRIAYVRTDDGRDVVVRGTSATAENAFTTIDRTYLTGHRYDFHPVNDTSPFEDNACTATLDLGSAPTEQPAAGTTTAETELADGDAGPPRAWLVLGAVAGVGLLVAGVVLVRRTPAARPDVAPAPDEPA
jgi:hypothetical protein